LRDLLQTRFGIRLPDAAGDVSTAELDAALARLP
jgi:N-hydroxyarylamine O-acetyltransferase